MSNFIPVYPLWFTEDESSMITAQVPIIGPLALKLRSTP